MVRAQWPELGDPKESPEETHAPKELQHRAKAASQDSGTNRDFLLKGNGINDSHQGKDKNQTQT
jgi:hypothetical protein